MILTARLTRHGLIWKCYRLGWPLVTPWRFTCWRRCRVNHACHTEVIARRTLAAHVANHGRTS